MGDEGRIRLNLEDREAIEAAVGSDDKALVSRDADGSGLGIAAVGFRHRADGLPMGEMAVKIGHGDDSVAQFGQHVGVLAIRSECQVARAGAWFDFMDD